jgi:hypothetical protein
MTTNAAKAFFTEWGYLSACPQHEIEFRQRYLTRPYTYRDRHTHHCLCPKTPLVRRPSITFPRSRLYSLALPGYNLYSMNEPAMTTKTEAHHYG